MVPLALTWLVGAAVALGIAHRFTQTAFDRALLDDAHLMAANITLQDQSLQLVLTPREVNTALFDYAETMFFSVTRADGSLVAGLAGLQAPEEAPGSPSSFGDIVHGGKALRAVRLHREQPLPFDVVVAATTTGRTAVLQRLLAWTVAPQLVLLVLLAWWLRRAIRGDMQPLAQLQQALDDRSASDLAPVRVQATTSDLQRLAGAVNSLLGRLDKSVRAQREFAGNVAHELRTPLAGIRALADYGLAQKDPASWHEQLGRIAASQARASRLVDQLLDLAVAQEAEASLLLEPLALDELVRDAVLRFLPRADAAGVDLGARGIDAPVQAVANATLVEGILNNLLDNALRYGTTGTGGEGGATVTVALETGSEGTVLSVQDNGSGLPGEVQAQLMKRGVQGETGQLLGQGAGLGLALVAQYATLMRARMELGSGPDGRGWVCRIVFRAKTA